MWNAVSNVFDESYKLFKLDNLNVVAVNCNL